MSKHKFNAQNEVNDNFELFPTPRWATRGFLNAFSGVTGQSLSSMSFLEPACGFGDISEVLKEYTNQPVYSYDIQSLGYGETRDFLKSDHFEPVDMVITNPPFSHLVSFFHRAKSISRRWVALMQRTPVLEGNKRHSEVYQHSPPKHVFQYVERVPMVKGRIDKNATTNMPYLWMVWDLKDESGVTNLHWIAPCRKELEKDFDYGRHTDIIERADSGLPF